MGETTTRADAIDDPSVFSPVNTQRKMCTNAGTLKQIRSYNRFTTARVQLKFNLILGAIKEVAKQLRMFAKDTEDFIHYTRIRSDVQMESYDYVSNRTQHPYLQGLTYKVIKANAKNVEEKCMTAFSYGGHQNHPGRGFLPSATVPKPLPYLYDFLREIKIRKQFFVTEFGTNFWRNPYDHSAIFKFSPTNKDVFVKAKIPVINLDSMKIEPGPTSTEIDTVCLARTRSTRTKASLLPLAKKALKVVFKSTRLLHEFRALIEKPNQRSKREAKIVDIPVPNFFSLLTSMFKSTTTGNYFHLLDKAKIFPLVIARLQEFVSQLRPMKRGITSRFPPEQRTELGFRNDPSTSNYVTFQPGFPDASAGTMISHLKSKAE